MRVTSCRSLVVTVVFLLITTYTVMTTIIYGDVDAGDSNDGSSLADVNNFLQDALASVESGDEIRVAPAIYRYELIDLGTLGGTSSSASSINDSGQIVGSSRDRNGYYHATLFYSSGGNNVDLGTIGGGNISGAVSINDSGQIVGHATDSSYDRCAVLFDPTGGGNNKDLGNLGGDYSTARSINNSGQIVGRGYNSSGYSRAVLFDPSGSGNNIDLGTLGGVIAVAQAINNHGQIVGNSNTSSGDSRATLFDASGGGNNIDLGVLAGSVYSGALSINDSGQIVGTCGISQLYFATLFDNSGRGNHIYLGTLGGPSSHASSINDRGQIVGHAINGSGQVRACLFDPTGGGNNIDLNTLIAPDSGWTLKFAESINNHGWIVGSGTNPDGYDRAYLLKIGEPRTHYVDADATGANNGLNWADAFYDLQDALASALYGDEIRVAQGIYKPIRYVAPPPPLPFSTNEEDAVEPAVDRTATFRLKNCVVIKGGYAGFGEPEPNARDIHLYETILSGDLYGNDEGFDNTGENCYRVVTGSGNDKTAILEGFTVTASCGESRNECGGVYNVSGSPTITNCTFIDNWTDYGYSGNGMFNRYSSPTVTNCIFDGSGSNNGMLNEISSLTVNNCIFIRNDQCGIESYGGNLTLTNCLFSENDWAIIVDYCHPIITNCTFTRNIGVIGYDGGAMASLTNCIVWDNEEFFYSYSVNYSCLQNSEYTGVGNITKDPLFVDPGNDDFRLQSGSPCINTGDPNYPYDPNETDLDGKHRVIGGRVDMGAYEFNHNPVADAGPDQTVETQAPWGATVTLDGSGSSDADCTLGTLDDINDFNWYEADPCDPNDDGLLGSGVIIECNLSFGEHVIILEVIDRAGTSDSDEVTILVQDTTPPDINCPQDVTLEYPADTSPSATGTATATDICGTVTITHSDQWQPSCGNAGTLTRTWTATDESGNESSCMQIITVVDTTPPEFEFTVTPTMLWPPNHEMVEITPSWTVSDECDPDPDVSLVSIVANEGDDVIGDGHTTDDIQIDDDGSIFVRSERSGPNTGRIYTITYQAVDDCGNVTVRSATVSIPHELKLLARMGYRWLWRNHMGNLPEDLNGDGIVNLKDIAIFANNWIQ